MADVLFVAATVVFFSICVAYVNWCDRIIGPDDFGDDLDPVEDPSEPATTPDPVSVNAMTEVPA